MREIKFRAWDKEYKTMGQIVGMDIPHNNTENGEVSIVIRDLPPDGFDAEPQKLENVILMQYTGLLDKNGKEIYEGDIIKEIMCVSPFSVVFLEGSFLAHDGEGPSLYLTGDGLVFEIIGNIYENPELLKENHV